MKSFLHALTVTCLLSTPLIVFSQANFFSSPAKDVLPTAVEATKNIHKIRTLQLDAQAMRTYLRHAPLEFHNNGTTLPLDIPLPNGRTETFGIVESPVLSPERAAEHPDIKTYTGNGLKNKQYIIRLALTSSGFSAIVLNVEDDAVYFQKYSNDSPDLYFSYFSRDAFIPQGSRLQGDGCGVGLTRQANGAVGLGITATPQYAPENNTGANLRTYRFAFAATAEFTTAKGGQTNAYNALVTYVNSMNAVYRRDLCVQFQLVSGTSVVYTTNGVPYTNSNSETMLTQCQADLDANIGTGSYDIGHVMGQSSGSGEGLAQAAACDATIAPNNAKAKGVSKEGGAPYAQVFFDQTLFHEVGHQYGMSHSFNSNIPVCTTRNQPTSVEPGAGATIMSYGFTCDADDYFTSTTTGPILFFHTINYSEMVTYMTANVCGSTATTGNTPPTVTVPSNVTIPKSTPFSLVGSATDIDGDALTYSWEGTNIGDVAVPDATILANTTKSPFFRTYNPVSTPSRTFPLLSAVTGGTNYAKGDKLPSVSVVTTQRLSVRDNRSGGGGLSYQTVTVTVDGGSGPFLVTNDLTGTVAGNSTQNITWSVNNTDGTNGSTVSVANVKISLSTDGGLTFPTIILASTPNDGTEAVTIPNMGTTTARIKVEAVGNVFFDLSNIDFTIGAIVPIELASFTGKVEKNKAQLLWDVKTERNTEGYQIERNVGGKTFENIGKVKAKGSGIYQFEDKTSVWNLGVAYYRLKIMDFDGSYAYSNTIALQSNADLDKTKLAVYPNPTEGSLMTVVLPTATIGLELLDIQGRVVLKVKPDNANPIQWNIQNLAVGTYILKAQTEGGFETVKVVKK